MLTYYYEFSNQLFPFVFIMAESYIKFSHAVGVVLTRTCTTMLHNYVTPGNGSSAFGVTVTFGAVLGVKLMSSCLQVDPLPVNLNFKPIKKIPSIIFLPFLFLLLLQFSRYLGIRDWKLLLFMLRFPL